MSRRLAERSCCHDATLEVGWQKSICNELYWFKGRWLLMGRLAGFTPSGPLFRKKCVGPYYINTPRPRLPSPDTYSSHYRHFVEDPYCNAHYYCSSAPHKIVSFIPYFNISGLLPCCKNEKKMSCAFVGALSLWGPCSAEHAEHA